MFRLGGVMLILLVRPQNLDLDLGQEIGGRGPRHFQHSGGWWWPNMGNEIPVGPLVIKHGDGKSPINGNEIREIKEAKLRIETNTQ